MVYIIRAKDQTIKTYAELPLEQYNRALGETEEELPISFADYANRFVLSCNGVSGQTISVNIGHDPLLVELSVPGEDTVDVDINGSKFTLTPTGGGAALLFSCDVPGVYVIQPADRARYCAAGQAILVLEVNQICTR